jgi:hypothetical protein
MSTKLLSSSRLRAVIGLATAALLVAGLLSSRVMAHHGLQLASGMQASTTDEQTPNFVASGGLVPDRDPSALGRQKLLATPMKAR